VALRKLRPEFERGGSRSFPRCLQLTADLTDP
jgi:hypothetical protein